MYGSQTGNAQSIAEGVHDGCQKRGLESTLLKCDAWKKGSFDLICPASTATNKHVEEGRWQ
ncbi:unnamed protein product [Ectocarpus sp. 6 AP-2014]